MDTKPLERFATWARRELINAVDAQTTAVLAVGSIARSERAEIVKKLEAEIGFQGRQNVVDKVAYTWFNRIIALRFMDARGYTGAAVVSPAQGRAHGQPEVLADAKRGNLDADVVTNSHTANAIIGLLDGTRRSTDAEGEAYALLLTEYCRHWHKPMPFMFEREGDYTELLVPANLLADGAILARTREVLTEDVCDDVEVIGWLYQFYISERKSEVFAGFKKNKKAGVDEIPAATQLFTPHWIVRYLLENSLGRLWMLNHPNSRLVEQMDYFIASADQETDFLRISKPEELTVIDPACGSGHMLTYAFDLLYAIYEDEGYAPSEIPGLILTHNLHGTEIDPRAGALAAFALTMKARAKQRTFFNKQVEPKIFVIEPISFSLDELDFLVTPGGDRYEEEGFWNQFVEADTLGSLIQPDLDLTTRLAYHLDGLDDGGDILHSRTIQRARRAVAQAETLGSRYSAVVANPPYMGSNNMGDPLSGWLTEKYPRSKSDLMTAFMERAQGLCLSSGIWGMINLPSWMFLKSFEALREHLLGQATFASLLHLGRGIFGADFGSVAFTVLNSKPAGSHRGVYRRLFDAHVDVRPVETIRALFLDKTYGWYFADQSSFLQLPGAPFAYWLSDEFVRVFRELPQLADVAAPKQGLATANDARFLRLWYEVSDARLGRRIGSRNEAKDSGRKWFPFNKGGAFRRWFGNIEHVIDWADDGRELLSLRPKSVIRSPQYYFEEAVGWSNVSSGAPAFRAIDQGVVFGHVGQSLFADPATRKSLLAILNSTYGLKVLEVLAPTIHYEVGSIAKVPVNLALDPKHESLVERLIEIARDDWDTQETSLDFTSPDWQGNREVSRLPEVVAGRFAHWRELASETVEMEEALNVLVSHAYGLEAEISPSVRLERVSLLNNPYFRFDLNEDDSEAEQLFGQAVVRDFVSFAIGCMFGRWSLDEPGLILADQSATLQEYLERIPKPTYAPDADNVIPFVDDGWFGDDIVERFRQFLRAVFGDESFEENLRFVEEALGVKDLRDYFITKAGKSKFYDDHVQRYKKRPIYWMFSSPKGSFNALIYMHRYTPSTVSTVLNEYLREYRAKLEVALANAEQAAAGGGSVKAQKEADRLRKVLVELVEYEHDVLYPLATQQIVIDLDDGVKANYPKFYPALKNVAGLEATE